MVFKQTDCQWVSNTLIADGLVGKPKGMERILPERGLWKEGLKKQCSKAKKEETEQHHPSCPSGYWQMRKRKEMLCTATA